MKRTHDNIEKQTIGSPKKIVLLGDGCTGKSTLFEKLNKLHDRDYQFQKKYKATDNFDFNRININTNIGMIVVDLWDTAGQENRGGMLRDAYLKGADGILLTYDMSETKTASNIPKWLEQIKKISPNVPVAVLGNKSDKFADLQQTESVKLRDCNLVKAVGHNMIKNFLISIKENTHLEFVSSFFSYSVTITESKGCMIGLEYVLSNIFNQTVTIT